MKIALVSVRPVDPCFPISLLCLQAYLKRYVPGVTIDIIDAAFEKPLDRIIGGNYDLIGISAMSAEYESAALLAKNIRLCETKPLIVVGGVHITKLPESFRDCFDLGIMGEGEEPLSKLIVLLETNPHPSPDDLLKIPGLLFRDGTKLRWTPPKQLMLESFPPLDYSTINPAYFARHASATFARFGREAYVFTSRGCPFKCVFCASSHFWNGVRYFSAEWVVNEIKSLSKMGVTMITLGDDLFSCHKKRMRQIADRIQAEGLNRSIEFAVNGQAGIFDEEICEILKPMNTGPIFFGFESGDEKTLNYLKCGKTTVEGNRKVVELCRRFGFKCWGSFIIGSPGETLEQMENTIRFIDWAKQRGVWRLLVAVLHPFPGTPVWDIALKMGRVAPDMDFDKMKLNSRESIEGMLVDDKIKPQFIRLRDRAYAHLHWFKWKKAFMLFRNNPIDALLLAFRLSPFLYKRLLTPSAP
jgi:radical SAM superfamily enzyme YgiQ (UPF0313 family)